MNKSKVVAAVTDKLEQELQALQGMANQAIDEATGEESQPENEYDTRALEASYLAAGQGQRVLELKQLVAWFRVFDFGPSEAIDIGALVALESDQGRRWVLLAPTGGTRVTVAGVDVQVISPESGLGIALAGLEEGDEADIGATSYEIAEVL